MAQPRKATSPPLAPDIQSGLEQALAHYRAGRMQDAATGLDAVLARHPGDPNALHLLGAIHLADGDFAAAAEALERAARVAPKNAELLNSLGSALRRTGRHKDAEGAYRRAIAVREDFAEAYLNLGNLLSETGRLEEAAASYRRAVAIRPHYAAALMGLGSAKETLGDQGRAEESYRAAVEAAPDHAPAYLALARVVEREGRTAECFTLLQSACAVAPNDAVARAALGVALVRMRRADEARAAFETALGIDEGCIEARVNLGNLLCARGDTEGALAHYLEALETDSSCVEAIIGIGAIAETEGRLIEAESVFRRALEIDPVCAAAHSNLGAVLERRGEIVDAFECYDRAIAIAPNYADAHANLGHALRKAGKPNAAREALDRALALDPGHVDARMNRAVLRLAAGDFALGWRDYLVRDAKQSVGTGVHREPLPANLKGRSVLALPDQGLGDEIFFLRFAAALRARGAAVQYRASPKIAAMIARSRVIDEVVGPNAKPAPDTLVVSVGDLPYLLGMTDEHEIPRPFPLPPLVAHLEAMIERLGALGEPPYFGLTWRAGTTHRKDGLAKSVPAAEVMAAIAHVPATLVALQRAPQPGEVERLARMSGRPVHDLTGLNDSLEEMLALLAVLDEYVCVSNTNVHLRAGAGLPSRVLVPYPPEFRWMEQGGESPWFPDTSVYRQETDGSWDEALAALAADLAGLTFRRETRVS